MEPHLRHPKLVIKLIVMPCDKRKPGNTKIRVQIARNVSKNGVKTKRAALLHRDISIQLHSISIYQYSFIYISTEAIEIQGEKP